MADVERQARADVAERFYEVLVLQQRVELEEQAVSLFAATADAVQKRRAAGEDTRLDAAIIIADVPFAMIGGIVGLFVSGQYLSVPSAIGFIAVFGVAMLNGIVLISFLNDQRRRGLSVRDSVRQGTALRLRPVLMTASVAILGLIPMLLSRGVGAETQRPLATIVVGGLLTSTALTLLLLPLIYEWAGLRAGKRAHRRPAVEEGAST